MAKLVGTVTQGSADAFASEQITTALTGFTNRAFQVNFIQFEFPRVPQVASTCNIELAVVRRSKTAMPNITDLDLMAKVRMSSEFTTSGSNIYETIKTITPSAVMLIVEDPIYFLIDSTATTLTQTAYISIDYDLVSISESERLNLLVQTLIS